VPRARGATRPEWTRQPVGEDQAAGRAGRGVRQGEEQPAVSARGGCRRRPAGGWGEEKTAGRGARKRPAGGG
jgi:hypothetical protein